ncbi:acyl-CoA dehydrogenase family protein [Nocardia jiangxiensis]|uniref:Acyl-CoA dehydrogenase family protein n=1 Tax=Nocardia jiangxiensis TaxID=282685 RepID=A0ABW6RU16_9NOCA|nr:acyl-CoA dehydrogenase family protein [Nocardia jiangxiensis]
MTLVFTPEQEELRATIRRFLAERSPSESVRRWMESEQGYDPELWRRMATELGVHGLALPEEFGGFGGGPVELGIVLEEMGRALLPSPYFATVALAGQALLASNDQAAQARWLPSIAEGALTATLAVAEESGSWRLEDVATVATAQGADWVLSGTKMFVIDGHSADLLLVVARTEGGPALFAVPGDARGLTRTRLETLDATRRLARIDLDDVPAEPVGPTGSDASGYLRTVLDLAVVALAAEQVGGTQACLDAAVEYAKIRVQFDRPIGSFQAIKHKCADLLLELEAARSATYHAAAVAAGDRSELPVAAALAAACGSAAFTRAAKENIQIHGGIGYTWEHDAHLYLKRAKSAEQLFGGPALHRSRLADLTGI